MNQRIRVLQQLGEEFERAVMPAPADSQESRHAPRPRRLIGTRVPRLGRPIKLGPVALAVAVIVPVAIVAGALLLTGNAPRPAKNVTGGERPGITRQAKVVAQAPDPRGGLPWAVNEVRTSRGQACLQVGRLKDGIIGALGQDGAYANDHRFHPMSPTSSSSGGSHCGLLDRNGNAFINIADYAALASAAGDASTDGAAHGAAARIRVCPVSSSSGQIEPTKPPECPKRDLRELAYGLLGPDAVSISYLNAAGRLVTEPTSGADGAYLIIGPQANPSCVLTTVTRQPDCDIAGSYGPLLQPGVITAVTYRNGHVCRLPAPTSHGVVKQTSCPPLGYRSPPFKHVTAAQVQAPITARVLPAKHYCTSTGHNAAGCSQVVLNIAFTARVAVTSANSYYEAIVTMPPRHYTPGGRTGCPGSGDSLRTTQIKIQAGHRVQWRDDQGSSPKDCTGNTIHISVAYVPNSYLGLNGIGSKPWPSLGRGAILVGKTSIPLP
jgi:hypothetical protein